MNGSTNAAAGRTKLRLASWISSYNRLTLSGDLVAALIVTIMLIPQSLAYAQLAGLPAEAGLYASLAPLVIYSLLGSSQVLAVGPVAVVSLMTAAAISQLAPSGSPEYAVLALTLAFLSGLILLAMGIFKLGFLANFLSHPVITGFISAVAILIAAGQVKHLLGITAQGESLLNLLPSLAGQMTNTQPLALAVGGSTLVFLFWVRGGLTPLLARLGVGVSLARQITKVGPLAAIVATTLLCWWFQWQTHGLKIVGEVPQGLPAWSLPRWDWQVWRELFAAAVLISIVGFVESISVAQSLAAKRRQRINPDQELIALGSSNIAAAFTAGFPVTGGLARSVVNFDAGANTPAAGLFTAAGILLVTLFFTPALYYLPQATLAATIVVAVLSLVDWSGLKHTWQYSRTEFAAASVTFLGTLFVGIESGLIAGVLTSLTLHLYQSSRPHFAELGRVPGTEHFRNVQRHDVLTDPRLISLRVDESLYFANARALEDRINQMVADRPGLQHLVLQCSAINSIDSSALESLQLIEHRLRGSGIQFHLSEVKGPVLDRLQKSTFFRQFTGQIFLTQYQALQTLAPS